jgi:3-deoxy-7-phosphoheptulonate synthase
MNETLKRIELPKPEEILDELPLSADLEADVAGHRGALREILDGRSDKMIMIAGPCSAWPQEAVLEYAEKIVPLAQEVHDRIMVVMRGYIQKPRTTIGWTGPLVQPDPYGEPDISAGIRYCRKMLLEVVRMGLPVADEMLFTHNGGYFDDVLSYLAVGARSAEDSEHRYIASALDVPVGIKNPTSGNSGIGINSLIAAQSGHTFAHSGYQITSDGNPYAHLILRGGLSNNGATETNYSTEKMDEALRIMGDKVRNPAIVMDASHDNCRDPLTGKKDHRRQSAVVASTLDSMEENPLVALHLKGWMIESFLEEGAQSAEKLRRDELTYGVSITDPCISLEQFASLAHSTYDRLDKMNRGR